MKTIGVKGYCTIVFISLLSALSAAQNNSAECSTVQYHLTQLTAAIQSLCGSDVEAALPSNEWESITLQQIGTINMRSTSEQSFIIPSSIPTTAKEVLVYVYAFMGYSSERIILMTIHTEKSHTRKFKKYLPIRTYHQDAWSSVSENMWFPLTSNRRIYVKLSRATTGNVNGYINVIGYR